MQIPCNAIPGMRKVGQAWQFLINTPAPPASRPCPWQQQQQLVKACQTCGARVQARLSLVQSEWFSLLHCSIKSPCKVAGVPIDEIHGDVGDEDVCKWGPGGEVGGCLDSVGFAKLIINLELKIGISSLFGLTERRSFDPASMARILLVHRPCRICRFVRISEGEKRTPESRVNGTICADGW
jgi:hypothetical protein